MYSKLKRQGKLTDDSLKIALQQEQEDKLTMLDVLDEFKQESVTLRKLRQ